MPATTRKGVWDLQQVRDQILNQEWELNEELWISGNGGNGNLGQNNTSPSSSPVQVPGTSWSSVSGGGGNTFGIKTDGTLWAWGSNNYGELGQNNRINYSSPIQIPGTQWSSVSGGQSNIFGIKTDGTLWAWGSNSYINFYFGMLGLNNITQYSSPVQIPGTQWSSVSQGANQSNHRLATKTDGTLWSWGLNSSGQLGQNSTSIPQYSSPVQIPGTSWRSVGNGRISAATKTDGTLWVWGFNQYGELGQNNRINYSSPIQIPGTQWIDVKSGRFHTIATKTDGTLWSWGFNGANSWGRLGLNDINPRSSPVQIPGSNWGNISTFSEFSLATKTDGTLWSWGYNTYGELGQNNNISYSSPVQIPGNSWSKISAGGVHSIMIKSQSQ